MGNKKLPDTRYTIYGVKIGRAVETGRLLEDKSTGYKKFLWFTKLLSNPYKQLPEQERNVRNTNTFLNKMEELPTNSPEVVKNPNKKPKPQLLDCT